MLAQAPAWGIHPFWVILWAYLTIGFITNAWEYIKEAPKEVMEGASVRFSYVLISLFLWPILVAIVIVESTMKVSKALKEARRNTAAVEEAKRLKEEIERLKDKLYELED